MLAKSFKRILICCFFLQVVTLPVRGQWAGVIEWLVDVGADVERKDVLKQLANAKFDSRRLNILVGEARKSGIISGNGDENIYLTLERVLRAKTNSVLNSTNQVPLMKLGNELIGKAASQYMNGMISDQQYHSLEDALSEESVATVRRSGVEGIEERLLADINADKRLVSLFRRHPDALKVYLNSVTVEERSDQKHLLYWSTLANGAGTWFSKEKLINGCSLKFEASADGTHIIHDDKIVGCTLADGRIECYTADLLNLSPFPERKYLIKNVEYTTDELGRVIAVDTELNRSSKGKSKIKSELKEKMILKAKRSNDDDLAFYLIPKKYNGIACYLNVFSVSKSNKKALKNYSTYLRKRLKEKPSVTISINFLYDEAATHPEKIIINVDGERWSIVNDFE